jgi:hypothetical protein
MVRYAIAFGALASTACSLLFNLEGFQGTGLDATVDASGDAASTPRDRDGPDGTREGEPPDSSANDSATDAASESPCKSAHLFCEDFETGIAPAWSVNQTVGTSVAVVSARARSGRNSLQLRKVASGTVGNAYITRVVEASNIRCEADVYYDALPNPQTAFYIVSATTPSPFSFFQYALDRGKSGEASVSSYRIPAAFVDGPSLGLFSTTGTWIHASFLVQGKSFTASLAGAQDTFSPPSPTAPQGWKLAIGVVFESTAGNWDFFLDDIFCDVLSMP